MHPYTHTPHTHIWLYDKEEVYCKELAHTIMGRFMIRNWLMKLQRLKGAELCSWQTRDPGEPVAQIQSERPKSCCFGASQKAEKDRCRSSNRQAGLISSYSWLCQTIQTSSWLDEGYPHETGNLRSSVYSSKHQSHSKTHSLAPPESGLTKSSAP